MDSGDRKLQYITTFCVSIASLTVGVITAWSTPVLMKLHNNETDISITDREISWMLAMNEPGFMSGSLATRFVCDRLGRRATLLASALPYVVGAVFALSAVQGWMLCLSQFLWGSGTGMIGTVVPIYLAEIADKDIRGTLSLSTRVMFSLGSLMMMAIGSFVSYYVINCLLLVLPVGYFCACSWIPESPYYHLKEGRVGAARKELGRLKGFKNAKTLDDELALLQANVQNEMKRSSSVWELFTGPQYRKAIVISAGLKMAQIMSGAKTIQQYLGRIVQESRVRLPLPTVLIVFGLVRFAVGLMSTMLVDRFGRRPFLYNSFFGTGLFLALVGTYFFLKEVIKIEDTFLSHIAFIPFTGIVISNVISTLGYISLIFVIPAEIFPINVKAVAMTSLNIFGGIVGFITTLSYQTIKDVTGLYGVFWIFAGVTFFGALFVILFVPETKGKSLQEIQVLLQGNLGKDVEETVELHKERNDAVCAGMTGTELEVLNDKVNNV